MELYLLKSAACLALLLIFYKFVLEGSSMHQFKRIYLLGALLIPFIVPAITFTSYVEVAENPISEFAVSESTTSGTGFVIPWEKALWTIYLTGLLLFGTRFALRLYRIVFRIKTNPKKRYHSIIKVLLPQEIVPHTFLSYIFLNAESDRNKAIPSEVIEHEKVHARELHSLDILLVEAAKVIFWFNPLFTWLGRSIKLNHEFLADSSVLRKGYPAVKYQETILAYSSHATVPSMAHSINYSSLKKRFTVMRTKSSRTAVWLRSLLLVPLLALTLYSFSSRETVQLPAESGIVETIQQTSASREEMKEYNTLARKYNAMKEGEREYKMKEIKRMKYIYDKMSSKQRADAEPFPEVDPPPPPPAPGKAPDAPDAPVVTETVTPPPPPLPDSPSIENLELSLKDGDKIFLDGSEISIEKAKKVLDQPDALKWVQWKKNPDGTKSLHLKKK